MQPWIPAGVDGGPCNTGPVNTYTSVLGTESCSGYPENSESPSGSNVLTRCQCKYDYHGANGGPCTVCQANTYFSAWHRELLCISSKLGISHWKQCSGQLRVQLKVLRTKWRLLYCVSCEHIHVCTWQCILLDMPCELSFTQRK